MKSPSKKLVYIMCLIATLFTVGEVALAFVNIPAALFANGAMVFFCIGMLFNIERNKSQISAIAISVCAILLSLLATLSLALPIGLLAMPVFAIITIKHEKNIVAYASIAVIAIGVVAVLGSFFELTPYVELSILAVRAFINAAFCIVMIKNKEIITND